MDWSMAAVVVALVLPAVPIARDIVIKAGKWVLPVVNPQTGRCLRLLWQDVPGGRVHRCGSVCHHNRHHAESKNCFETSQSSIAAVFDHAWLKVNQRPTFVEKPQELSLSSDFVCTDARTILAFVMCTVADNKSPFGESWFPREVVYGPTRVDLIEFKGILIAHIRGASRNERQDLTKHELNSMLECYPPWYREKSRTRAGVVFDSPIRSEKDVYRGGWIVAVGLRDDRSNDSKPLAVYRSPNEPETPQFRENGVAFRRAVERCRDRIQTYIEPHFQSDENVKTAIKCLTHLVDEKTGSGIEQYLRVCEFGKYWTNGMPHLTGRQCVLAMTIMNDFEALMDAQVAELEPILLPVMDAVVRGAYEVIQYLKDTGVELYIPPLLRDFDRTVYLRDCSTKIPLV